MACSNEVRNETDLPAGLSAPAQRALAGAGIKLLADLAEFSEAEVTNLHGIGPNALKQLRAAMDVKDVSFSKR